jgi:hypothetical protein
MWVIQNFQYSFENCAFPQIVNWLIERFFKKNEKLYRLKILKSLIKCKHFSIASIAKKFKKNFRFRCGGYKIFEAFSKI